METVLFNKPRGLVCTASDELGRETIYAALPQKLHHLKNVGRLDKESEGIIVLSNDGDLALTLTHPRQKVEKEYIVTLNQAFQNEVMDKLVAGIHTPEGRAAAKSVRRLSPRRVSVVLETGLKRQIRLMFEAVHLRVTKLVRVRIGSLTGGGLETGEWRTLETKEIEALKTNPVARKQAADVERAKRRGPAASKRARKTARKTSSQQARRPANKKGRGGPPGRPPKRRR
jgi:23S rRNA pseudouridine2605 synthase